MKFSITRSLVASIVLGLSAFALAPANAQGSSVTRALVKMERDAFFAMARWDPTVEMWVVRDDMPMSSGVMSRAEVKAMRDKFLEHEHLGRTALAVVSSEGCTPEDEQTHA